MFAFSLTPTTRVPALLIARHRRTGMLVKRVVTCDVPQTLLIKAKGASLEDADMGWISIVGATGKGTRQPLHVRQTGTDPATWEVIGDHDGRLRYLKLIGLASSPPSSRATPPSPPPITRMRARAAKGVSPSSTESPAPAAETSSTSAVSGPRDADATATPLDPSPAAAVAEEMTLDATASAALADALAMPRTEDVRLNLGPIDTDTAIRHLRAAGLSRDEYDVSSDGTDFFVTLHANEQRKRRVASS